MEVLIEEEHDGDTLDTSRIIRSVGTMAEEGAQMIIISFLFFLLLL